MQTEVTTRSAIAPLSLNASRARSARNGIPGGLTPILDLREKNGE
jgi:hypothetical protein